MMGTISTVTIAICTYNRCQSLKRTLDSLITLEIPAEVRWEVLVVDNNCTDDTAATVGAFHDRLPIRQIVETNQGLSWARNRAVKEAGSDIIVFTDDDVLVEPGWLAAIAQAAREHPEAGYFGGRIVPFWPEGRPRWVREETLKELGGLAVNYDVDQRSRWYHDRDPGPIGANMAFRRILLQHMGPFRTDIGVAGNNLGGGEDTEMIRRFKKDGIRGYYVANAVCHHATEADRTTLRHAFR